MGELEFHNHPEEDQTTGIECTGCDEVLYICPPQMSISEAEMRARLRMPRHLEKCSFVLRYLWPDSDSESEDEEAASKRDRDREQQRKKRTAKYQDVIRANLVMPKMILQNNPHCYNDPRLGRLITEFLIGPIS